MEGGPRTVQEVRASETRRLAWSEAHVKEETDQELISSAAV